MSSVGKRETVGERVQSREKKRRDRGVEPVNTAILVKMMAGEMFVSSA
jgi:hypothetical protein